MQPWVVVVHGDDARDSNDQSRLVDGDGMTTMVVDDVDRMWQHYSLDDAVVHSSYEVVVVDDELDA